jgi:hypothetical protein
MNPLPELNRRPTAFRKFWTTAKLNKNLGIQNGNPDVGIGKAPCRPTPSYANELPACGWLSEAKRIEVKLANSSRRISFILKNLA